jgi:hypothetical protein
LGLKAGSGFAPSRFLPHEVRRMYNFHGAFSITGQITKWFGVNFGYHIGPGILFLDIRALRDLTPIKLEGSQSVNGHKIADLACSPQRGSINFSIGYEIGELPKAQR